jgi:hypothetical protein
MANGCAPLALTDLEPMAPGLRRLLARRGVKSWARLAKRIRQVAGEAGTALARGAADRLHGRVRGGIRLVEPGDDPAIGRRSVALYVHFSPDGRISDMVFAQLRAYAAAGFAVAFVSMSRQIPPADWARLGQVAALRVLRDNYALDFGAWQALVPLLADRWPEPDEVLLTNDSVLGPLHPLAPIFAALRAGGEGVFGLTESLQGGAHLQSYFLLARGRAAVGDLLDFLRTLPLTGSKWLLIQRSELRLSQAMRARGHRVAALFGYRRLLQATAATDERRAFVAALPKRLVKEDLAGDPIAWVEEFLQWRPLNPTHHLWRALVAVLGFPFIKTELVRRNPGELSGVERWPELVGPDSPCPPATIAAHLALMGP